MKLKKLTSIILTSALLFTGLPLTANADTSITTNGGGGQTVSSKLNQLLNGGIQLQSTQSEHGDIIDSGQCGDNVYWTLYSDGLLNIIGTGDMWDFEYNKQPYFDYKSSIESVVFGDGVTRVGGNAFREFRPKSVQLSETITYIGGLAFWGAQCDEIDLKNVQFIGAQAFRYSTIKYLCIKECVNTYDSGCIADCWYLERLDIYSNYVAYITYSNYFAKDIYIYNNKSLFNAAISSQHLKKSKIHGIDVTISQESKTYDKRNFQPDISVVETIREAE